MTQRTAFRNDGGSNGSGLKPPIHEIFGNYGTANSDPGCCGDLRGTGRISLALDKPQSHRAAGFASSSERGPLGLLFLCAPRRPSAVKFPLNSHDVTTREALLCRLKHLDEDRLEVLFAASASVNHLAGAIDNHHVRRGRNIVGVRCSTVSVI